MFHVQLVVFSKAALYVGWGNALSDLVVRIGIWLSYASLIPFINHFSHFLTGAIYIEIYGFVIRNSRLD